MADALPFSRLLDVLRVRGIEIGVTHYRDLGKLLSKYDGCDPRELRIAIASLLARDRGELKAIADCFDDVFPWHPSTASAEPPTPTPLKPAGPRAHAGILDRLIQSWRRFAIVGAGIVLLLATIILPVVLVAVEDPVLPPLPDIPSIFQLDTLPPVTVDVEKPPPPPPDPVPPEQLEFQTLVYPAVAAFVTVLGARLVRRAVFRRSARARSSRESELAAMVGPRFYRWHIDDRIGAVPRHVVEEIATMLARRHETARTSNHLDVNLTIRRTLEAGLFPRFAFEPPCRTLPLLVLQDVGVDMRPWQTRINHLLTDLERLGVPIWRYYFDVTLHDVWHRDGELGTTLDALSRSADDAALLVISAGAGVRATLADRREQAWLRLLEKWPARTWVNPLTSRAHWRPELTKLPVTVWPMTPGGLHAAARELLLDATHRPSAPANAVAGARRVTADDLERVNRLLAVALPPVPVELIEALRVRFTPDVPPDVVLALLAESESLDSGAVRLPDDELKRLLAGLRRDNPERETEIRRFLQGLLEASEPPRTSLAHARWQADRALHQVLMADAAHEDPSEPLAELASLARGPLRDEVRRRATESAAFGTQRKRPERLWSVPPAPPTAKTTDRTVRGLPGLITVGDLAIATAAALIATVTFFGFGGVDLRRIDHQRRVWELTWDSTRQTLSASPSASDAPTRNIRLMRETQQVASVSLSSSGTGASVVGKPLSRDETGYWYQLQAPLPAGNLALSNKVYVPGPLKPGHVLATFQTTDNRPLSSVPFTLTSADGQVVRGVGGQTLDVPPGYWTLGVQLQGYEALYESLPVERDRNVSQQYTLSPTTAPLLGTVLVNLVDVYGDPANVDPYDLRGTQRGRETVKWNRGATAAQLSASRIDPTLGPLQIEVSSSFYYAATFSVTVTPGGIAMPARVLIMQPDRVRAADFRDPPEINKLGGSVQSLLKDERRHANLLNVFARSQKIEIEVDRPQGTFSRLLWSTIQTIDSVSLDGVTATLSPDAAEYVRLWMRLRSRPSESGKMDGVTQQNRAVQQPNAKAESGSYGGVASVERLSLGPDRANGTILDLYSEPSSKGEAVSQLRLSLRAASSTGTDPYLIHQLLVLGGHTPPYRLRFVAATKKK